MMLKLYSEVVYLCKGMKVYSSEQFFFLFLFLLHLLGTVFNNMLVNFFWTLEQQPILPNMRCTYDENLGEK